MKAFQAAPSLIDPREKVRIQSPVIITSSLMKSPTTGQWWSEERQSDIRLRLSSYTERCLVQPTTWQTTREKSFLSVYTWEEITDRTPKSSLCSTTNSYFKFTHMKYLYSTEKLFHFLQHCVYYIQIRLSVFISVQQSTVHTKLSHVCENYTLKLTFFSRGAMPAEN